MGSALVRPLRTSVSMCRTGRRRVVTNKPSWLTQPLVEHFALHRRAGIVVSGDTLAECKSHPAPLLHAAEKLGVTSAVCIYIGDGERDVLAAQAAWMRALVALYGYIAVPDPPDSTLVLNRYSRHRCEESYAVLAKPILGGLHHEYTFAPACP
jgi:beta-phosphoglucomutase-like phosphatase (HAD superfamily)